MSLDASRTVFRAREAVASLLGAPDSSRIAFTLNATMALNIALAGWLRPGDHVLATSLEHNSVARPLTALKERLGVEVEIVQADGEGRLDPADFRSRLRKTTRLAVVNHVSNVIGSVSPVRDIRDALEGVPLLVDAAQSAGGIPLAPVNEIADMVAFTGHKGLFGPTGTGGLWVRPGVELAPLVRGGTGSRSEQDRQPDFMPDALEAGTQNTHGLAGLAAGVEFLLEKGVENVLRHERRLTGLFMEGLSAVAGVRMYGPADPERRGALVSVNLDGWSPSDLARELDRHYGIMTRAGLHCAPWAHRTIGTFPAGTVRFSFGWFNTEDEVGRVLAALAELSRSSG